MDDVVPRQSVSSRMQARLQHRAAPAAEIPFYSAIQRNIPLVQGRKRDSLPVPILNRIDHQLP